MSTEVEEPSPKINATIDLVIDNADDEHLNTLEVKAFSDLLIELLSNDASLCKVSIKLDKDSQNIITKLLNKSPIFLNDIEKLAFEIIKDNKIDFKDLPNIIAVIQKLYVLIYSFKAEVNGLDNKRTAEITGTIFKFVIHTLVEEKRINIEESKKIEFLELTDKLVDISVELLTTAKSIKNKSCIKYIFGLK